MKRTRHDIYANTRCLPWYIDGIFLLPFRADRVIMIPVFGGVVIEYMGRQSGSRVVR